MSSNLTRAGPLESVTPAVRVTVRPSPVLPRRQQLGQQQEEVRAGMVGRIMLLRQWCYHLTESLHRTPAARWIEMC